VVVMAVVVVGNDRGSTESGGTYGHSGGGVGILLLLAGVSDTQVGHAALIFAAGDFPVAVGMIDSCHLSLIGGSSGIDQGSYAQDSNGANQRLH
jgi:hypothetical protein